MLNDDFSRYHQDQMAFVTPVVGDVRGAIFHHPKLNLPELARAHGGFSGFARMF
jgi:hypothetical protein